jgi:serine/threonine protein phosphatase PrpC
MDPRDSHDPPPTDDAGVRRHVFSQYVPPPAFRPSSNLVRVEMGARSQQGHAWSHNDQHYIAIELSRHQRTLVTNLAAADLPPLFDEFAYALLVADGVGQSGTGAMASRVALSTLAHLALVASQWNLRIDDHTARDVFERALWFYEEIDEAVLRHGKAHAGLAGMATSLTAAYSSGQDLFVAHVGHSRAYLFRNGELTQLTTDQTLEQRLADSRRPAPIAPAKRDGQHMLIDAIGGEAGRPPVQLEHVQLADGDRLILCTNGLAAALADQRMADVLSFRQRPQQHCDMLVEKALQSTGEDNITVVIADYHVPAL